MPRLAHLCRSGATADAPGRKLYAKESFGVVLDAAAYARDSTTIDLCRSLFPWAHFVSTKSAVTMRTLLDLRGNIPAFIRVTTGDVHNVNMCVRDERCPSRRLQSRHPLLPRPPYRQSSSELDETSCSAPVGMTIQPGPSTAGWDEEVCLMERRLRNNFIES